MQFRDHPALEGKRDFYAVDPRKLKVDGNYNVRDLSTPEAKAYLEELKASVIANGVRVPLEVRLDGEDLIIVAGHCRHSAVMAAIDAGHEIKTVPIIPEPKTTNEIERTINLAVSNSGKPLTPMEMAEIVRRLLAFGWQKPQIAQRLGWKSEQTVDQYISLLGADAEVQSMVRNGEVSASTAAGVIKSDGNAASETLKRARDHAKKSGKKKITAKSVKAARGQLDLKPKQVKSLVEVMRHIAKFGDGRIQKRAIDVLEEVGLPIDSDS